MASSRIRYREMHQISRVPLHAASHGELHPCSKKRHVREQDQENLDIINMDISPGRKEMETCLLSDLAQQRPGAGGVKYVKVSDRQRGVLHDSVNIMNETENTSSHEHKATAFAKLKREQQSASRYRPRRCGSQLQKNWGAPKRRVKKCHTITRSEHKVEIPCPTSIPVLDDDLLPMDVDLLPMEAKIRKMQTKVPSEVHSVMKEDPLSCSEYDWEVYQYLRILEAKSGIKEDFLAINTEITQETRAMLNDWLIQVQVHQELTQQTLHLAVNMMDKILSKHKISLSVLQLLGTTCLLVAAKYVDRFPPEVHMLCHLTDNSYSAREVLCMERFILKELQFDINLCEPITFLNRFVLLDHEKKLVKHMSQYILDLTLISTEFVHILPSNMAASALYLARKILGHPKPWSVPLAYHSKYSENDVLPCSQNLAKLLMKASASKFKAAANKFSSVKTYDAISIHPALENHAKLKEFAGIETVIM